MTDLPNAAPAQPSLAATLTDPRTLHLENYLTISKLHLPKTVDWTGKKTTPWGMMGNWDLFDCLCAAAGHMIECWTANTTGEEYIDDNSVLNAYIALTGYDPITGQNKTGVGFTNLMKYWRSTGISNHKIKAYTAVKYIKPELVRACIYLFGGAFAGLAMPKSLNTDLDIWDIMPGDLTGDNAPGSDGGHAIALFGYDEQYITFVTWGKKKQLTWAFWQAYSNELYAVISPDFFNGDKTALGFDVTTLEADLIRVTREKPLLEKEIVKQPGQDKVVKKPVQHDAITTAGAVDIGGLEVMAMDIGWMNWADGVIACEALGGGWHLPTQEEMQQVFLQKDKIGRFASDDKPAYWTATHHGTVASDGEDDGWRYYQMFDDGGQYTASMDEIFHVRAVRESTTGSH